MATVQATKQTQLTMVQALQSALVEEMERDEDVVILGEDIGPRGGVFLITEGLIDKFGADRVIDTPLAEAGIIGAAVGMAMYGLKPIAEIQFIDFIFPGFDLLVSEAAKIRYRSAGQFGVPMVIRSPYGGGVRGGSYHSQSPESYFVATPGLKVVVPSNPYDAKGLLIASVRDPDPVVFMEPKKIYRAIKSDVPAGTYEVPLGKAALTREGKHVSIITYGAMVHVALEAADAMAKEGVEVEVLDLRTLQPYDTDAIMHTIARTGHVVL
ncbi:MAG: alpha-ketoacid dehydrogenase subunit beta, partial [Candidatus Eremiobacteraeota bacterium]|nr:alpha-ketoacid dehydrogenase subunit beta [Candidatus Eremiobacteraeota bacterium]